MARHMTDTSAEESVPAIIEIPTHEEVAARAFQLYEERGEAQGGDFDDWLEAERQLLHERMLPAEPAGR